MQHASGKERKLAAAVGDPSVSWSQFCQFLRDVPAGEHFRMPGTWTEIARNADLDPWRRLAAYQILIERCISYPLNVRSFIAEAILAIGVAEETTVDMTPAHNLPFARKTDQKIGMVTLPIPTAIGSAALYFAVREVDQSVEEAAVYPTLELMKGEHGL